MTCATSVTFTQGEAAPLGPFPYMVYFKERMFSSYKTMLSESRSTTEIFFLASLSFITRKADFEFFFLAMGPLSLAPMFPQLIKAFDSNLTDVVQFTGVAILILGFSNFIWVPLSTSFGRRPVYLASTLVCLGSAIWRARATSYGSFMGASVLNGLGAGPAETIQPNVIADVMFLHKRGFYQTLYFAFYFGSLMVSRSP